MTLLTLNSGVLVGTDRVSGDDAAPDPAGGTLFDPYGDAGTYHCQTVTRSEMMVARRGAIRKMHPHLYAEIFLTGMILKAAHAILPATSFR